MSLFLLSELWRLNRQQWVDEEKLETIRMAKLRRQAMRAYELSPFHRKRYQDAGFHPSDLKTMDDLRRIPITTRSDYIAAGDGAYCSDVDIKQCVWAKSSGSSGSPVRIPLTRHDKQFRVLKELRSLLANGYGFTDKMMILWVPRAYVDTRPLLQRFGLLRRRYDTVFAPEPEQLASINAYNPDVLYTYTSNFRILAEEILSGACEAPKPKLLITSAELLDSGTRQLITKAFAVEPVDFYGSMEMGWIAWQCQARGGYHINADCVIVECLRDGAPVKPGEDGEFVITSLHSDAAPLIRYATGDTGRLSDEKCSCGRTLPLLAVLSGRMADYLVLPGGKRLSPYAVTSVLRDVPGMQRFQVVQEAQLAIRVYVQATSQAPDAETVRQAVRKALNPNVVVEVEYMESLPREPNGKFKIVKSMVALDPTEAAKRVA